MSPADEQEKPPAGSFAQVFFAEMLIRIVVAVGAMALSYAGSRVGHAINHETGPAIGAIVGLLVGAAIGIRVLRRRS